MGQEGSQASSERFDYEYQEAELREFVPLILRLAHQAERVHVVFNHSLKDEGIRGARNARSVLDGLCHQYSLVPALT